ncbi:hypothetical protein NHX12_017749 [Muraenolepis orangiensis]|uniref:Uncharacterized protein n=1 Tax=Muraenolepis orangiensis TaxID=630683 RepID=A0A9Q0IY08_9TELE|nr:hypothetical protein NHX12_017749 [Muraenolepis orangiensis]
MKFRQVWKIMELSEDQSLMRIIMVQQSVKLKLATMFEEEENGWMITPETFSNENKDLCAKLELLPTLKRNRALPCGSWFHHSSITLSSMRCRALQVLKKQRLHTFKNDVVVRELELCWMALCCPGGSWMATIDKLGEEKQRRHAEFLCLKEQIIHSMNHLEWLSETSLERNALIDDKMAFCLSLSNISSLKLLLTQLEDDKVENERWFSANRAKIQEMWNLLQTPQGEREENWRLFLELEHRVNNPSRLNTRGGNLLIEEKQRTELQKSLPKQEKSLKAQIDCWEQDWVGNRSILEYMQQQRSNFNAEKEREKTRKQVVK